MAPPTPAGASGRRCTCPADPLLRRAAWAVTALGPDGYYVVASAMVVATAILPWTSIALQGVAVAQENPYGKVDTSKVNISLLRTMVGTDGTPMAVSVFDRLDPTEADRLFEALLDHDVPAMRTLAGVALVKRGAAS